MATAEVARLSRVRGEPAGLAGGAPVAASQVRFGFRWTPQRRYIKGCRPPADQQPSAKCPSAELTSQSSPPPSPSTLAMASPARLFLSVLLMGLLFSTLDSARVTCPTCFTEITENGVTKPGPCAYCKSNPKWSGDTEVCGDCGKPFTKFNVNHCGAICGSSLGAYSGKCKCYPRSG